jgi:hypothetical protein
MNILAAFGAVKKICETDRLRVYLQPIGFAFIKTGNQSNFF